MKIWGLSKERAKYRPAPAPEVRCDRCKFMFPPLALGGRPQLGQLRVHDHPVHRLRDQHERRVEARPSIGARAFLTSRTALVLAPRPDRWDTAGNLWIVPLRSPAYLARYADGHSP